MLINSSLGRNTLGFKPSQKNFEHLEIVPGLSTDFTKNLKKLMQYAFRKERERSQLPDAFSKLVNL